MGEGLKCFYLAICRALSFAKGGFRASPGRGLAPGRTCFIRSAGLRRGFHKDGQQDEGPHHHCFSEPGLGQVAKPSWPDVHGPARARASIILGQKQEREMKRTGENKAAHTVFGGISKGDP